MLADLLGSQHLFEILQASFNVKSRENVVKSGCFEKRVQWRVHLFFEIKEECKISSVKIIVWSIVFQEGTNILIFYIFEYGAEYGAECCAESGGK